MYAAVVVLVSVILTVFGITLFRAGTKSYLSGETSFVLINAKNPETIEHTVRRAAKRFPECTIYIMNKSKSDEMPKLLTALESEFDSVKIILKNPYEDREV